MSVGQRLLEGANRTSLRLLHKTLLPRLPIRAQRGLVHALSAAIAPPRGSTVTDVPGAPVPAKEMLAPGVDPATSEPAILHLHGGGHVTGTWRTERSIALGLSDAATAPAYVPDYRLVPENPYPAAIEDLLATYEWLAAAHEGPIVLSGDSAGAGLALAGTIEIRDRGMRAPAALCLISPWVDMVCNRASYTERRRAEAVLDVEWVRSAARAYAGDLPLDDPRVSPLYADHSGLPPTLIQAGSDEIFFDEIEELAIRLEAAGVDCELGVFDGMWHDFQIHWPLMQRSREALDEAGAFISARV